MSSFDKSSSDKIEGSEERGAGEVAFSITYCEESSTVAKLASEFASTSTSLMNDTGDPVGVCGCDAPLLAFSGFKLTSSSFCESEVEGISKILITRSSEDVARIIPNLG